MNGFTRENTFDSHYRLSDPESLTSLLRFRGLGLSLGHNFCVIVDSLGRIASLGTIPQGGDGRILANAVDEQVYLARVRDAFDRNSGVW